MNFCSAKVCGSPDAAQPASPGSQAAMDCFTIASYHKRKEAMSVLTQLCRRIHNRRVRNANSQYFIPEGDLLAVITKDTARSILPALPLETHDAVLEFVIQGAHKVLAILALINHVSHIICFISSDGFQNRPSDNRLPLTKEDLCRILRDDYVADLFYDKQWEFCAPVFSKEILPRVLDTPAILPFTSDDFLDKGGYGTVHTATIHPRHCPEGFDPSTKFVRKELEADDATYANEVHVLSVLQRLHHPNILRLLACYTHRGKHNLIFPYVAGGTLRKFLQQPRVAGLTCATIVYLAAGLASALWALHEIFGHDTREKLKGHHQDLRPANILYDGERLILADFGLSTIKSVSEDSRTPLKGRVDYYQAPESADLSTPYEDHETTRATDIFALGCIFADLVVYLVNGPSGVENFAENRKFVVGPIKYCLYHKGTHANGEVASTLYASIESYQQDHPGGILSELVQLVLQMLEIDPGRRPSARVVTEKLYATSVRAFSDQIDTTFETLRTQADAIVEHARFISWRRSFETHHHLQLPPAQAASIVDHIIKILQQLTNALFAIDNTVAELSTRDFLEIRQLNTELLDTLSIEGRQRAQMQLKTIILKTVTPDKADPVYQSLHKAFCETDLTMMADTTRRVARYEQSKDPEKKEGDVELNTQQNSTWMIIDQSQQHRLKYQSKNSGTHPYNIIEIQDSGRRRTLLEENVQYDDPYRRSLLLPRIQALCDLLSNQSGAREFCVLPFYGLHDDHSSSFGLLFDITGFEIDPLIAPRTLHQVITRREPQYCPPLETRLALASKMANALSAFHDVDWYHKNLTSHGILFLPSQSPDLAWLSRPYIIGFQHSRAANEDFSEGPPHYKERPMYHDPRYLSKDYMQFKAFRPEFDYYSLGIMLLEIGLWNTVDEILGDVPFQDNQAFSRKLKSQLRQVRFYMGSRYAAVVQRCLEGIDTRIPNRADGIEENAANDLRYKENITQPLQALSSQFEVSENPGNLPRKRTQSDKNDSDAVSPPQKRTKSAVL